MAIKIIVSNTVGFKVKGAVNDEKGVAQPFHFELTCVRLNEEQFRDKMQSETEASITDFLADVIEDWSGVRDPEDKPLPYTEANLRLLCRGVPGVSRLMFQTYLRETVAKEKN